jgi:hypothetical protein
MPKLNQVISIATGKKTDTKKAVTAIYHGLQKTELFNGMTRTYSPIDEEGETLPSEKKIVQKNAVDEFAKALKLFSDLFDVIATQENANCSAKADIMVEGVALAKEVPVTYLLFLEKQLDDILTIINAMPTLSPDVNWIQSSTDRQYLSEPVVSIRTKKVPKSFLKAPATDKHPAQVEVFTEDVPVGRWTKVDQSTAIPSQERENLVNRVAKLREAVKMAREEANSMNTVDVRVGQAITQYILGK